MTGRGLGHCILRYQAEEAGSDIRGYAGLRGAPVNIFLRDHVLNVKPGIDPRLLEPGLAHLKRRIQTLTQELSRLRDRISELEKER
jgi:hypothetical protein